MVWRGTSASPGYHRGLSKAFLKISQDRESVFSGSIVTNGYLLDRKAVDRLVNLCVTEAQVTLDGPAEIHDQRRPLRDGQKTFNRIIGQVKTAADKIKIAVRMNVDEQNCAMIDDLLDILVRDGLSDKLSFYLGHTSLSTPACKDYAALCLHDQEFHRLDLETSLKATDRGFGSVISLISRNTYCEASVQNSFLVSPSGAIGKCWYVLADDSQATGHLLSPATQEMETMRRKWICDSPFERECHDCLFVPVCMGGCPYLYQKQGKVHCIGWKHHPEENLLFYYFTRKKQQELEAGREFRAIVETLKNSRSQKGKTIIL